MLGLLEEEKGSAISLRDRPLGGTSLEVGRCSFGGTSAGESSAARGDERHSGSVAERVAGARPGIASDKGNLRIFGARVGGDARSQRQHSESAAVSCACPADGCLQSAHWLASGASGRKRKERNRWKQDLTKAPVWNSKRCWKII